MKKATIVHYTAVARKTYALGLSVGAEDGYQQGYEAGLKVGANETQTALAEIANADNLISETNLNTLRDLLHAVGGVPNVYPLICAWMRGDGRSDPEEDMRLLRVWAYA